MCQHFFHELFVTSPAHPTGAAGLQINVISGPLSPSVFLSFQCRITVGTRQKFYPQRITHHFELYSSSISDYRLLVILL